MGFSGGTQGMLVRSDIGERAVTNHIQPLKELAAGDIEHDVVCRAACFWHVIIEQVFHIVLVDEGPAELLAEGTAKRAFAGAGEAFQGDQPHVNAPYKVSS